MFNEGPKSRIRLKFARLAPAAGLTHLQQLKVLRDRIAVSGLKFTRSNSCGGAPKMAFGPAVSVGHESLCEYADVYLEDFTREAETLDRVRPLDDGQFSLLSARRIPVFFPSLEAAVNAAEFWLEGGFPAGFSQASLDAFLALESRPYEKVKASGERRELDARKPLLAASWDGGGRAAETDPEAGAGQERKAGDGGGTDGRRASGVPAHSQERAVLDGFAGETGSVLDLDKGVITWQTKRNLSARSSLTPLLRRPG